MTHCRQQRTHDPSIAPGGHAADHGLHDAVVVGVQVGEHLCHEVLQENDLQTMMSAVTSTPGQCICPICDQRTVPAYGTIMTLCGVSHWPVLWTTHSRMAGTYLRLLHHSGGTSGKRHGAGAEAQCTRRGAVRHLWEGVDEWRQHLTRDVVLLGHPQRQVCAQDLRSDRSGLQCGGHTHGNRRWNGQCVYTARPA